MRRIATYVTFSAALAAATFTTTAATPQSAPQVASATGSLLSQMQWRSIGPDRGGRSIAVSGVKGRPREAYFGAVGGGLWKTTDGGENWLPVTDGQINSASVGAVAVSESNPDVVYIGMGESCIRGNIMPGDGVYKSTDAGKTWRHIGFSESQAISRIRIHPSNPDIVYVASFGKYGAPSEERGVFKSTDGGKSWKKTLYRDDKTGAVDLSIDHRSPNVIYAALWEAYRIEWQMSSGGPGSGLFKSTDGGETWTELTRRPGMPSGVIGRIGVSVSGADSNRVYALVENEKGGLFSSDDAGETWTLVNSDRNIRQRAFYYTHVHADPVAKDTVYMLNVSGFRSTDGGKTLQNFAQGTHSDHHDLWINPDDPKHLVLGNDGGGAITMTGAAPWTAQDFPTAQYYHVANTAHIPFHLCGAQQDGSTVCISSDSVSPVGQQIAAAQVAARAAATGQQAPPAGRGGGGGRGGGRGGGQPTIYGAGGSENGTIAPDPKDVDVIFSGGNNGTFLTRLNRKTGEQREVNPYPRIFSGEPSSAVKERWQWSTPLIFSPVNPQVLYTSSQHLWKTTDQGQNWSRISGDLTRHDPKTMGPSGGPITGDMNGPEIYAVIFAIGPGKTDENIIWTGSDDGLVHVTRDGGKSWQSVTPKEMPEFGRVSQIDASRFDAGTAYVSVRKPLLNDLSPYIFRTHDFGKTWTKIVNGIRKDDYVHVVREDRKRKGMLYAGTQHGFYVSYDDGGSWQSLSLNLPDVPVSDAWLEDDAIAISTHGRSFYVLDNLNVLRSAAEAETSAAAYLFPPADAIRGAGGATFGYLLKKPAQKLTLEVLDAKGQVIYSVQGAPPQGQRGDAPAAGGGGRGRGGAPGPSVAAGLNRTTWNLAYPGATTFPGMVLWGASTAGPAAVPGQYQVRLTVDGQQLTQPFTVRRHPLRSATDADLKAQFDLALQIRDKVSEANNAVIQIRSLKAQIEDRAAKAAALKGPGDALAAKLTAIEEEIYQTKNQSGQDPLNFPIKINNRIASLNRVVNAGDGRPIGAAYDIFKDVTAELKVQTDRLAAILKTDLPAFDAQAKGAGLAPLDPAKPLDPPPPAAGRGAAPAQQPAAPAQQTAPKIDEFKMMRYQAVFLKKGSAWSDASDDLQKAHRAYQASLVSDGKVVISGPFVDSSTDLRGAFIVNGTPEQARALADGDPGVKAGRWAYDVLTWMGPEGWFQKPAGSDAETLFFGFLVNGPNRTQDQATAQALQRQHLDYMDGQAKEGHLVLAGPLDAPQTPRRGLIAYRAANLKAAVERASADPMVKAGRLAVEMYRWSVPRGILK